MRLLFVTVSRSDFSILNRLIKQTEKNKFFDTRILVTGEHLSKKMGYTKNEILKNFKNKNYILKIKDTLLSRPKDILLKASIILKLTTVYIKKTKPELIVLLGDRYEVFHFAFAAWYNAF